MYGCETWPLILREKRRLRLFENSVLRLVGLKRDKVTGEWRKLHSEELNYLYSSRIIVRVIKPRMTRRAGHVARMGRDEVHTIFLCGEKETTWKIQA